MKFHNFSVFYKLNLDIEIVQETSNVLYIILFVVHSEDIYLSGADIDLWLINSYNKCWTSTHIYGNLYNYAAQLNICLRLEMRA